MSAASFSVSTRCAPEDMTSTALSLACAQNTSELAICATWQPRKSAAALAVRAAPGSSTICASTPAFPSACRTRSTLGLVNTAEAEDIGERERQIIQSADGAPRAVLGLDRSPRRASRRFVRQHGVLVYALLFVIVFCENRSRGDAVPAGKFAAVCRRRDRSARRHGLFVVSATLIAAALCGDNCNYWIGRWAGMRLFGRWINPVYLQRTHDFYERHGGKTIILARFVPIVRTYVPFVAGLGAMPYLRYIAFCVAGAVIWVGSLCTAGYFLGNIPVVKNNLALVILLIVFLSILPGLVAWGRSWARARSVQRQG